MPELNKVTPWCKLEEGDREDVYQMLLVAYSELRALAKSAEARYLPNLQARHEKAAMTYVAALKKLGFNPEREEKPEDQE